MEDRAIYAAVEAAVVSIIQQHQAGEFNVNDYPDLVRLVRIVYPGFHVSAHGVLAGFTSRNSLP